MNERRQAKCAAVAAVLLGAVAVALDASAQSLDPVAVTSAEAPPDAVLEIRARGEASPQQVFVRGSRGAARCMTPCRLPVYAGLHDVTLEGWSPFTAQGQPITRGVWHLDVTPDRPGRRTGGAVMLGFGIAGVLGALVPIPFVARDSWGLLVGLFALLPSGVIGLSLGIPGAVLVGTASPRVDLVPIALEPPRAVLSLPVFRQTF